VNCATGWVPARSREQEHTGSPSTGTRLTRRLPLRLPEEHWSDAPIDAALLRAGTAGARFGSGSVVATRYTGSVPDVVTELLVTEAALDKLGARTISADETEQLLHNEHVTVRNPKQGAEPGTRRLLIGRTNGGRSLTLVIEQTVDPTTWLIVTGWEATESERKILGS